MRISCLEGKRLSAGSYRRGKLVALKLRISKTLAAWETELLYFLYKKFLFLSSIPIIFVF